MKFYRNCLLALIACVPIYITAQVTAPVIVATNTTIRVMAANLTTSSSPRYQSPGLNIMKGLKPDIVAIQEFNYESATYGANTANAFREMLDQTFGTNYVYYRETGSGKDIPNGVISRYPILASGFWDDVEVSNRDFVWVRLDIPGTNDLYVVSVHLLTSSATLRAIEATNLTSKIQTDFPTNAYIVVAGDFNIGSTTEPALARFKQFFSDAPIPTDAVSGGNDKTNQGRTERYDYVLPSFTLDTNRVPTVIGSKTFNNGLVFDSRVYTPLSDVSPVVSTDSSAPYMQHMAVVKDFRIPHTTTNYVTVTSPHLTLISTNILRWQGQSNVIYSVQASTNLTNWPVIGTAASTTTNIEFTNASPGPVRRFFRITYP